MLLDDHVYAVSFTFDASGNEISQQGLTSSAPAITAQPSVQVAAPGGTAGFSVTVSSSSPVTYQWQLNGVNIQGATGDSLLISNVTAANQGNYTVVITNGNGSVTSNAGTLYVNSNGEEWVQVYSPYVQSLIAQNSWGASQANMYVAFQSTTRTFPLSTGAGLPVGGLDPNFFLVSQPAGSNYPTALQVVAFDGGAVAPGAQYITPQPGSVAVGTYDYQTTFDSNFSTPTLVVVSGAFSCDNSCVLQINGQGSYATAADFSQLYPIYTGIVIPAGKQSTRLDFMVTNTGGPSSLIVSDLNIYIPPSGVLADNGFETPDLGGQFQYNPVCPNWGFAGTAGITSNGAEFDAQGATRGQASDGSVSTAGQAAFLQKDGSMTQYVTLPAGTYNVSFDSEARQPNDGNEITVSLGGNVLFDGTPTLSSQFVTNSTAYVTLPAGTYALTFTGMTSGQDVTTFIDNVFLNNDPGPFVWQGGAGDFNDPQQWGRNRPPGPADTATINSGSFTVSGPIYAGTVIVNVPFTVPSTADFDLDITGNWNFTQPVTLTTAYQFNVTGGGTVTIAQASINGTGGITIGGNATINFTGTVDPSVLANMNLSGGAQLTFSSVTSPAAVPAIVVTGAGGAAFPGLTSVAGINQIYANNGAKLSFSNVTNFTAPNDTNVSWWAENSAELDFPALTAITGPLRTQQGNSASLDVRAVSGGVINFAALTTITEPAATVATGNSNNGVTLDADNSGQINAPLLTTFDDFGTLNQDGNGPGSGLVASDLGVLALPRLIAPVGVQMDLNDLSNPGQFTSLVGTSSFQLNGGTVALQINDISGLTSIYVAGTGTKLSFPNVANYTAPNDTNVSWRADDNGELDFPALVTMTGPLRTQQGDSASLDVRAVSGGVINFAALTTITEPAATVATGNSNNGVTLDADNSGQINAPLLATFNDFGTLNEDGNGPGSGLVASDLGVLALPRLIAPVGVQMDLNDLSNPGQFTSLVGTSSFQLNGGTVAMQVSDITGLTSIYVSNGAKLSFPNVTTYTAPNDTNVSWHAENNGELDFPALVTITGPLRTQQDQSDSLDIRADNSGIISFAALTMITEPAPTVQTSNSNNGVILDADNSGQINAPLLGTFRDSGTINLSGNGPASLLYSDGSGTMNLAGLSQAGVLGVTLNGIVLPQNVPAMPPWGWAVLSAAFLFICGRRLPRSRPPA